MSNALLYIDLKEQIKKAFIEVLTEEKHLFADIFIPYVEENEQVEIIAKYPSPNDFNQNDFVEVSDWFN